MLGLNFRRIRRISELALDLYVLVVDTGKFIRLPVRLDLSLTIIVCNVPMN